MTHNTLSMNMMMCSMCMGMYMPFVMSEKISESSIRCCI